jgi:uncharacterized small protein (DUF1192 family)
VASTENQKRIDQQELSERALNLRINDLEKQFAALKNELEVLKKPREKPKQEPNKEACKCLLTKEGFWARFHQLRSEGLSKSDAFRLVSLEMLQVATTQ